MKKIKLVSFLVLSLTLSLGLPALVTGQTAPPPGGNGNGSGPTGKPTPAPTATPVPTPVIGDDDCDDDLQGCLGGFYFLCDWGGRHHRHDSRTGDRGRCGRD